jgi:hypothetical protein
MHDVFAGREHQNSSIKEKIYTRTLSAADLTMYETNRLYRSTVQDDRETPAFLRHYICALRASAPPPVTTRGAGTKIQRAIAAEGNCGGPT